MAAVFKKGKQSLKNPKTDVKTWWTYLKEINLEIFENQEPYSREFFAEQLIECFLVLACLHF